jgi:hypothetical protein
MHDRIKSTANEAVLGLLFVSLLVIYQVVPQSNLVMFLSVVILAISLFIAVSSDWSELNVLAVFAGIISVVAAFFLGRTLRFGNFSGVVVAVLWGAALYMLSQRIVRGIRVVSSEPDAPAILIGTGADRRPYIAEPPLVIPWFQPVVALIPRDVLIDEVEVTNINTKKGHNIEKVVVHVRYQIIDPVTAYLQTPQVTLDSAAKSYNRPLEEAKLDVSFWEHLFEKYLLRVDVDKAVREVVFERPGGANTHYEERKELAETISGRLNDLLAEWGATVVDVELNYFEVNAERFRNPAERRKIEVIEAEHQATIEAMRIRQVLNSEVNAEAERVKAIVRALRESNVEITPEVVIRAIRAASDWVMESDYTLLQPPGGSAKVVASHEKK